MHIKCNISVRTTSSLDFKMSSTCPYLLLLLLPSWKYTAGICRFRLSFPSFVVSIVKYKINLTHGSHFSARQHTSLPWLCLTGRFVRRPLLQIIVWIHIRIIFLQPGLALLERRPELAEVR